MDLYAPDVYEKFAELTKEELIQHLVSYEFGKLLKKYKNDDYLEDLWVELEELLGAIDDTLRGAD